ncbi:DUF2161 domain-containing phosphodiesterase [Maritimibacter dapengensis]|uniref:Uncharacterized protein n=1 Tax=Maritimibacter dapengensis TaxID=2836868 RepID=A0ABS6T0S4_9RHOB|nr:DUF2161 family putative PD-(D/E)XK-type phosphodiesterase [Maritimibacter dapengensis]MBV7377987.1 hypothetical protein [Maritimibacter dapengensis]
MAKVTETDLYPPVKAWLQTLGYEVKSEIGPADVVAIRPDAEPLVVELKAGFSLTLLQQAVARQAITDTVYVAVPRWSGKTGWRTFKGNVGLAKRLGIGVLSVALDTGHVQVHADPVEFKPRKSRVRRDRLLKEFAARTGDPNLGGTNGQITTAYKQDCARIHAHLMAHGPSKGVDIARATGVTRATRIMYDNHLGWFVRVETGLYDLSDTGRTTTP